MVEFFNSDTMISITLIYMCMFMFYHVLVFLLWYFKKRIVFKLYPPYNTTLILYSIIQGSFMMVGAMSHILYLYNTNLPDPCVQYVVFLGFLGWATFYLLGVIVNSRSKIRGDF